MNVNTPLKIQFDYHTNFPIRSNWALSLHKQTLKPTDLKSGKNFCKNFIILILFLKFLKKSFFKKVGLLITWSFFIKPNRQNIFNYLRAPYKNKLARNQVYIPRYKFSIKVNFLTPQSHTHVGHGTQNLLINLLKSSLCCFESNVTYLNRVNIKQTTSIKDFWNYKI